MKNTVAKFNHVDYLWDEKKAKEFGDDQVALFLYRSNILGADLRITNFGGGNTSCKTIEKDPLTGKEVEVLWVKGSGGDIGSIKMDGFASLYMDKLQELKSIYQGVEYEDEMVGHLLHCIYNLNPRAASIDTPLHAYVPHKHVDHVHADAIISIAASKNSKELTQEIFGDNIGWLPWKRPGFELGLWLEKFCLENPNSSGVILESHGLFTWGETAKDCYDTTINIINIANTWLDAKIQNVEVFGGAKHESLSKSNRHDTAAELMPRIRGFVSTENRMIGHFTDDPVVLEYINSYDLERLAPMGTSCPDHFLRTKIQPLVLTLEKNEDLSDADAILKKLEPAFEAYRAEYVDYYNTCKKDNSPAVRDANPVIIIYPGVGMFSFAKNKQTTRVASEFYINAINVMRGAEAITSYTSLPRQEAFDIEYWALEEAKLQRMPPECE